MEIQKGSLTYHLQTLVLEQPPVGVVSKTSEQKQPALLQL